MVEVIEYLLVFGITVSLAAFSIMLLGGSLPILDQSQTKAQMVEIASAADLAALKGNATVILPLSNASIGCSQGVMTFSSGGESLSSPIGSPCSFQFNRVSCLCKLVFTGDQGGIALRVDD